MKLSNLSLNQKLGAIAILLGLIAVFMPDPMKSNNIMLDTNLIGQKINDESSKINVTNLADNIIKGKTDFTLVDLSSAKVFNDYHIPSAVNFAISELNDDNILRNQKIILYADDNLLAAQAWFLLKAKRYNSVYLLEGGLQAWKQQILFPSIPDSIPADKISEYNRIIEVCKFFGGQPQQNGGNDLGATPSLTMPKISSPSAGAGSAKGKKPKKEGC